MFDNIKIVIVEDEDTWLLSLKALLESLGFEVTGTANNISAALALIQENNFDIALLDIAMEQENAGITLGSLIRNTFKKPFIFITANSGGHLLHEAAKAKPSAYLIKPADRSSLYIAIQNAIGNFLAEDALPVEISKAEKPGHFFVKRGKRYIKLQWEQVVSLTADQKYTAIEIVNDTSAYHIRSSLQNTIKHIVPNEADYIKVNKSQYINLHHIQELNDGIIITTNNTQLPVSETHLTPLKEAMNIMS